MTVTVIFRQDGKNQLTRVNFLPAILSDSAAYGLDPSAEIIALIAGISTIYLVNPLEFTCPPSPTTTEASSSSVCSSETPAPEKLPPS